MNDLYNSLINGSAYTTDTGEVISTPPTALNLRAARVLKQVVDINDSNVGIIAQLQQREQVSLNYAEQQRIIIETLIKQVDDLTKEREVYDQSIRDSSQEVISMGSGDGQLPASD